MKQVVWLGRSKREVQRFPSTARKVIGRQLYRIQEGDQPTDYKPMPMIGPGVMEMRIHRPHEYRVIYIANFAEAVYVLHAFQKQTQQIPMREIEVARTNYAKLQK